MRVGDDVAVDGFHVSRRNLLRNIDFLKGIGGGHADLSRHIPRQVVQGHLPVIVVVQLHRKARLVGVQQTAQVFADGLAAAQHLHGDGIRLQAVAVLFILPFLDHGLGDGLALARIGHLDRAVRKGLHLHRIAPGRQIGDVHRIGDRFSVFVLRDILKGIVPVVVGDLDGLYLGVPVLQHRSQIAGTGLVAVVVVRP